MLSEAYRMAEMQYRQRRYLEEAKAYRLARQAQAGAPAERTPLAIVLSHVSARNRRRRLADAAGDHRGSTSRAA